MGAKSKDPDNLSPTMPIQGVLTRILSLLCFGPTKSAIGQTSAQKPANFFIASPLPE
jgi:hypothetical protein